jgi:hypothetical protein
VQNAPTSKLPSVPINIRLRVNALPGTNALAYYQLTVQDASASKLPFINIRLGVNAFQEKKHLLHLSLPSKIELGGKCYEGTT